MAWPSQLVHHLGVVVEGVGELQPVGHPTLAKALVVRRNDAVLVGQLRDEISEHMRRRREAVKQQKNGSILRPCFTIEHVHAINFDGIVSGASRIRFVHRLREHRYVHCQQHKAQQHK